MRSIALFAALCSIVVCETQKGEFLGNNTCQALCHMQKKGQATNVNLTRALKGCCDEATACALPAHFYNLFCVNELMDVCLIANFEERSASNLTWRTQHLCRGNCTCNETGREFKGSPKCFKNISVDWNNETFFLDRDQQPLLKWKRKQWEVVLKMSTQTCLNSAERISLTPSLVAIKFKYPIFTKRENYEKKFVHGFYAPVSYLVMKKGDHDMLTILGESVKHLWVTLCICITWTLISGVIIWLLDRQKNPLQFPSSFWQGFCEGTWWAVVTMTTVGYGDRSPRSFLARMYAAVWMVVGMVTLSIFTAEVSSVLTAREMIPRNTYLSKTIGVPVGSKNLFSKEFRGGTIKEMDSMEDLENHLQTGNGLHRSVLHTCVDGHDVDDKQIIQVLNPHIVGIKMSVIKKENSETTKDDVVKCVREKIEEHPGISPLIDDDDELEHHKKEECNIETRERSQMKDFHHWDLTAIILYASLGLLAAILIAGNVWDMTRSREQENEVEGAVETRASFRENAAEEPIEICVTMGGEHERKN